MKNMVLVLLFVFACLMIGCTDSAASRLLLTEAVLEVVPAPEIHGANQEMKSNSGAIFINGGIRGGNTNRERSGRIENILTKSSFSFCDDCGAKPNTDYKYSDLFYEITSYPWYGSISYISKKEVFNWGLGLGFDNAIYGSLLLGVNKEHFEAGATVVLGAMPARQRRSGLSVGCQYEGFTCDNGACEYSHDLVYREYYQSGESEFTFAPMVAPGLYFSVYWNRLSFDFSGSAYKPYNVFYEEPSGKDNSDNDIVQTKGKFLPAWVFTNHYSIGYRLRNGIGFRAGVTQVYGEFEGWHWFGFGGLELAIF